jgi:putative ABC transport system permease protein
MLKNYLKVAFRNIIRYKGYTSINIFGLAIGIACCLLILTYDLYELGYDRYNKNADNIFRVELDNWATTPVAIGPYSTATFSDIKKYVRFIHVNRAIVERDERVFSEKNFFFADSTVFDVFSFKLISGNPSNVLASPNSLVITKGMALKYFGNENPVGKQLKVNSGTQYEFTVTGVVENPPAQSHFKFDFLASSSTLQLGSNNDKKQWAQAISLTYLLIPDYNKINYIEKDIRKELLLHTGSPDTTSLDVYLRPLTSIHLYSNCEKEVEPQGSIEYVYILSSIALFLLLLAIINFINLSTAQALNRSKEIAVRKTLGADRKKLIIQYIGETFLITFAASVLALAIVQTVASEFNSLTAEIIFTQKPELLLILLTAVICIIVTAGAGSYPAFYLSRFEPFKILKSGINTNSNISSVILRKGLVIFQFVISIVLLIGMQIIYKQLDYIQNQNLGLNKDQVLILPTSNISAGQYSSFKTELMKHSEIKQVSASLNVPAERIIVGDLQPEGKQDEVQYLRVLVAGFDFPETFGMNLKMGRSFSKIYSTDSNGVYLLNEKAASLFGWNNPLGKRLTFVSLNKTGDIVGVIKDFNYSSLHSAIEPLAIYLTVNPRYFKYISVSLGNGNKNREVNSIENTWKQILPNTPFEYYFLDESFDNLYRADMRLRSVVTIFTFIGIIIACLGLLGLVSKSAELRTKEIGIRKVLGASIGNILILISKDFIVLTIIADIIAWPLSYYLMNRWLETFAYKTIINPFLFVFAGILVIAIALVTVSYHALKAATSNPVKSLKYE